MSLDSVNTSGVAEEGKKREWGDWTAALLRGMDAARSELVDWGMAC